MMERIMNNWAWKILSLVLAFVFWVAVVNYDDPYITKQFEDLPVEKRNEVAITSQEKAITYLEGETIDVRVGGNRSRIDALKASDIQVYADMKKVSITGAIDIEVDVLGQVDVLEKTPNNMQISLEQVSSELKDVRIYYEGELAKDHIKLNPLITPNQIEIKGPESKLAMVSSVIVKVDIDEATDDVTLFASPKIQDSAGNDILDLEVSNSQIQIKVPIEKIKIVPVRYSTVGEINNGFRLMSMNLEVDNVIVRGEDEVIDDYTKVLVTDVDLGGLVADKDSININLAKYLPEGIQLYGSEASTKMLYDLRPIVSKEFVITADDIIVKGLFEQLRFKFVDELAIPVVVEGIAEDLDDFRIADLFPSINLRNLELGDHEVELELIVPNNLEVINELQSVRVELSETPVEEIDESKSTESGAGSSGNNENNVDANSNKLGINLSENDSNDNDSN